MNQAITAIPDQEPSAPSVAAGHETPLYIRVGRMLPVAVTLAVLLVAMLVISPWPVGAYEDDGIYTVLAKALATGEGYRMINLPGAPHATHYPPGYPLLLAALWRVFPDFPDNIVVFKFANAFLMAAGALGAFTFARRRLGFSPWGAAAATLAGSLSVLVLFVAGVLLSEPLFIALLFPALLVGESSADTGKPRTALAAGLLAGCLTMVRTLGAPAIAALFAVLVLRRHWRAAIVSAAAASLFLVPWQLWIGAYHQEMPPALVGKYGAYGPWLIEGFRSGGVEFGRDVFLANLRQLDNMLSYALMPVTTRWPRLLAYLIGVALLLGGLRIFSKRAPVTQLFVILYTAIILLWPFEPDRFVIALWPVLVLLGGAAIVALWRWAPRGRPLARAARVAALAAAVAVVAGHAAYNWRGYSRRWWEVPQRNTGENAKPLVEWVARHTDPDDVLSIEHDLIVYLYTGRRAVPTGTFLPRHRVQPSSPGEFTRWAETLITTHRPRYFISGWRLAVTAADSLSARTPALLRPIDTLANAVVYERLLP